MIFDGHSDILYGMNQKWQQGETDVFRRCYENWFRQGQVEGSIAVLWSNPDMAVPAAVQVAQQLQTLKQELETCGRIITLLRYEDDLIQAQQQGSIYFLLGVEGLDGYPQEAESIDWLYEQGVRHVGLTWNGANDFAGGVHTGGGLTDLGRHAVRRIQKKRMLLDVSHLNDRSLRELLYVADGPVIASHSNCRKLCDVPRNLTDEQIKAIAATGGMIGVNSHPSFVHICQDKQDLQRLADHVIHMADLVGVAHVGFGFDLNYWEEDAHAEEMKALKGYQKLEQFLALLRKRGFAENELEAICRGNFLRLLRQTLA